MDLSIIIVNWNSTDYLRDCLASLYRETHGITFEVVVVDNASRDDSCSRLIRDKFPQAILHCSRENLGFAGGSNIGADVSTGDTLLFLNPDTEIRSDVFTRMVSELVSNADAGAGGCRLLNSDGSLQLSCVQSYPTLVNQLLDSEFLRRKLPQSRLWGMQPLFARSLTSARVEVISGACLMIKRDVFSRVGRFDDSYFMYVEDVDLCRRINAAGYGIHYMDNCEVIHHGGKSSAVQGAHFANLRQQEAMLQFFAATKGKWYSFLYRGSMGVAAALRLVVISIFIPFRKLARASTYSPFSLQKWSCIFRWAIGLEVKPGH